MDEIYLNNLDALESAIQKEKESGKIMVCQIAPAVRVTIGEEFGFSVGEDLTEELVYALKKIGFNYVFDTPLGADITIYEELSEFEDMLKSHRTDIFPLFSSCCIGWYKYYTFRHPELKKHISPLGSPNMIMGSVAKNYLSKKLGKKPKDICMVSIMPCTIKKYETLEKNNLGQKFVDYVITTAELAKMLHERGLDLKKKSKLDNLGSQSGLIFGATGGVSEGLIKAFADYLGKDFNSKILRENDGTLEKIVRVGDYNISIAIVFGFSNLEKLLEQIENEEKFFHFVEVMQCPYGCVGGPGQIPAPINIIKERARHLRQSTDKLKISSALKNKDLKEIYKTLKLKPGSKDSRNMFYRI